MIPQKGCLRDSQNSHSSLGEPLVFFFNKIKLKYTILGLPDGPVAKTPHSLMQGARVPSLVRELDLRSCSQISCIAAKEIEGLVFCS